jgi:DHA2 family multidrug resistance protein
LNNEQALATINRTIDQQAYTLAATDLFYASAGLFVLLLAVLWWARPAAPTAAAAGEAAGAHG